MQRQAYRQIQTVSLAGAGRVAARCGAERYGRHIGVAVADAGGQLAAFGTDHCRIGVSGDAAYQKAHGAAARVVR